MVSRPDDPVCRNCGLPIARPGDPLRGVARPWLQTPGVGPSAASPVLGIVLVIALLLIGATLATSGGGILTRGGRLGVFVPPSAPAPAVASPGPYAARPTAAATLQPGSVATIAPTGQPSRFSCENATIHDASMSRWRLQTVRAGKRKQFERVTLDLVRAGHAKHAARATIRWMSPAEARETFGLPKFDGQRGLLVSFSGPVSMTGTQLIGQVDLSNEGMRSISGIYRFVDFDGGIRVFVALGDRTCADIRSPQFDDQDGASKAGEIFIDLGGA